MEGMRPGKDQDIARTCMPCSSAMREKRCSNTRGIKPRLCAVTHQLSCHLCRPVYAAGFQARNVGDRCCRSARGRRAEHDGTCTMACWAPTLEPHRVAQLPLQAGGARHGVGLAAAGLPVGEDARVVPRQAVLHDGLPHRCTAPTRQPPAASLGAHSRNTDFGPNAWRTQECPLCKLDCAPGHGEVARTGWIVRQHNPARRQSLGFGKGSARTPRKKAAWSAASPATASKV